eukprot:SAG11_NODE_888_length_6693_cov_2.506218_6_plen_121_part_00
MTGEFFLATPCSMWSGPGPVQGHHQTEQGGLQDRHFSLCRSQPLKRLAEKAPWITIFLQATEFTTASTIHVVARRGEDSASEAKQAKADLKNASSKSAMKAEKEYWKEKKKSGAFKNADG